MKKRDSCSVAKSVEGSSWPRRLTLLAFGTVENFRRRFWALILPLALFSLLGAGESVVAQAVKPNIVILFADDLGYGDLQCYGHPTIRTPNLDRMATEGMRFTDFYSAASVCTPSRAGLMTGRLPIRSGMCSDTRRVLFPDSAGGIPEGEITLAEALKEQGYATACIGKWHLGHLPQYLPTRNGFDFYFGIPYSNDMDAKADAPKGASKGPTPRVEWFNVPLLENEEIIERPADQTSLTRRYTEQALKFISDHKDQPFFIYLPYAFPHVPLFASEMFKDKSPRGIYGDVVEEMDGSVGRILDELRNRGLEDNTLVFFTSDNGPWLTMDQQGGSAGLLRDGKGCTWEGGMREPGIAWWPGTVPAGTVNRGMASTLDLYTTAVKLAGGRAPDDRILDGVDLGPLLEGNQVGNRDTYFYYRGTQLFAVRKGRYKAHFKTRDAYGGKGEEAHDPPLLYDLAADPSERFDVAAAHPEVVAEIGEIAKRHRETLVPGEPQLDHKIEKP